MTKTVDKNLHTNTESNNFYCSYNRAAPEHLLKTLAYRKGLYCNLDMLQYSTSHRSSWCKPCCCDLFHMAVNLNVQF